DDLEALTAPEPLEGPVSWLGLADTYFATLLVPSAGEAGTAAFSSVALADGSVAHGVHYIAAESLAAGAEITRHLKVYVGPKDTSALLATHPDLGAAVELGWFAAIAGPLLW